MSNLDALVESLSALKITEAAELVKMLEEKWGVSAAAPVAVAAAPAAAADAGAAPSAVVDLVLESFGDKKLDVIKEVKNITGLPLGEAKALVEGAPKAIKSGIKRDEAEGLKAKLEAAGAKISLK